LGLVKEVNKRNKKKEGKEMNTNHKKKGVRMRTVYKNNAAVIDVLIAAVVATLMAIGVIKVAHLVHQDPPTCAITAVAAKEGDTLWGIAEKYCPDRSRTGETVTKIIAMNNGIVSIHAGQVINLPFKEGK
jgi:hypothetical protein